MHQRQTIAHGAASAGHAASSGQSGGGASVDLSEE
jgi:type IV secretion system protein TrbL